MSEAFDVVVIGSGAGGGPVALTLAKAGKRVLVLERGPWLTEKDFTKDEVTVCQRSTYTPSRDLEPHVVEVPDGAGGWASQSTAGSRWDFWNGNMVGGSTNVMSGFFLRMKPIDFRLRSEFGPVEGADVVDWPITYEDLEPWYELVEREIGISGRVVAHPRQEPRSTPEYPFPPLAEHPFAAWIDEAAPKAGLHPVPTPRAILSKPVGKRLDCAYSGYCGSYGCPTGAKGSSRAALLGRAVETGRCEVRPLSRARRVVTGADGRAEGVVYVDQRTGESHRVEAKVVVVACQAIETARLLLLSTGPKHPAGLGNRSGLVGRNLLFCPDGAGLGDFPFADLSSERAEELRSTTETFVHRTFQDWYVIDDPKLGPSRKGGTVDFLLPHPNPITTGWGLAAWDQVEDGPIWGTALKDRLRRWYQDGRHLRFEVFADWLPVPDCRVTLDPQVTDRWGIPSARVRLFSHPRNREAAAWLADRGADVLRLLGARNVRTYAGNAASTNLVAGTCRFGKDPATSVLDRDCRVHDADNVYVTDGSFMPTGGSVPYTWTIYANAFRVADRIVEALGRGAR